MVCINEFKVRRAASIRGVAFHIDTGGESGGHRKVDHDYPNRDDHYIEDLGWKSDSFQIKGYLSDIDRQGDKIRKLRTALKGKGACSFYHPLLDEMFQVEVTEWGIDTSKDSIGRVDFSFTAVKVPTDKPADISPTASASPLAKLATLAEDMQEKLEEYMQPLEKLDTLADDVNQVWSKIDDLQTLQYEPGRALYNLKMSLVV